MSWSIYMDRRRTSYQAVVTELESLARSVPDLALTLVPLEAVEESSDAGKFRDFVEIGQLKHPSDEVLNWVAEELVDQLGWAVDIRPLD